MKVLVLSSFKKTDVRIVKLNVNLFDISRKVREDLYYRLSTKIDDSTPHYETEEIFIYYSKFAADSSSTKCIKTGQEVQCSVKNLWSETYISYEMLLNSSVETNHITAAVYNLIYLLRQ
jgi:hypothetical protein